jgi:molybdopterin-guanine dinucleotide biosynthesis protein A
MPYVTREIIQIAITAAHTSDAAIPRVDGRAEPVCAAYRRTALPAITAALNEGRLRAADLVESLDVTWLEGQPAEQFRSLNTPVDLEAFNAQLLAQR